MPVILVSSYSKTYLTCMIDHFIPPSCSSELPCSRKTEPNAPFACHHCLHMIHDGPPNSSWDIPKPDTPLCEDTPLLPLPGKSLFSFYSCRLKIFFFIELLLSATPRQDLVERIQRALRLLHSIQDELLVIEYVLTDRAFSDLVHQ